MMEIGNLLWGHLDPLEFEVDRDEYEDEFYEFLTRNGFDEYGHIINEKLEKHLHTHKEKGIGYFETNIDPNRLRAEGHKVGNDPETYILDGDRYIIENDVQWDGEKEEYVIRETNVSDSDYYFENDTFLLRPFYWGDCESISVKPNFIYKPDDLVIEWYKYPFRNAYSNVKLDKELFTKILKDCEVSLRD